MDLSRSDPWRALLMGVALVATLVPGGVAHVIKESYASEAPGDGRVVYLSPADLRRKLEAGEAVRLPTPEGEVLLERFERQPGRLEILTLDAHGNPVTVYRESDTWRGWSDDGAVAAVLTARSDGFSGQVTTPQGVYVYEPVSQRLGEPLVLYRVRDADGGGDGEAGPLGRAVLGLASLAVK